MVKLYASRVVNAPRGVCYDLVRSVDAHAAAVPRIRAKAEAGRLSGLLNGGEWTEWSAVYFGFRFRITMEVAEMDWPFSYVERRVAGMFDVFTHQYRLVALDENRTMVTDSLCFHAGWGSCGVLLDRWLLAPVLRRALDERMDSILRWAEDGSWRQWLDEKSGARAPGAVKGEHVACAN
ncbi:MAG: hypothetical protein ACFCUX_01060 [Candidatus Methylacidiphilales bacterium]